MSTASRSLPSPVVRVMRPDELPAVRALSMEAFGGDPAIGLLIDLLRASWSWEDGLSFVADLDGELVGHVIYSHAVLDAPERLVDVLVLSPLGVRPSLHRSAIGSTLVTTSLAALATRPEPLVFLEGSPAYYPRFGFRPGGGLGFHRPSLRIPEAAFQVFPLPSYEPWMTGTLVYPDAFWRADAVGLR